MTPVQLERSSVGQLLAQAPDAIRAECCRRSLYTFVQEFWDVISDEKPVFNWHIEFVCREFERVLWPIMARKRKSHDVIVNIPPGTTKSTMLSIMAPHGRGSHECQRELSRLQKVGRRERPRRELTPVSAVLISGLLRHHMHRIYPLI